MATTDHAYNIKRLHDWQFSCEYTGDAWPLFLDLSGYSDHHYDERQAHPQIELGHLERTLLAKALLAFTNHGIDDVHQWIEMAMDDA